MPRSSDAADHSSTRIAGALEFWVVAFVILVVCGRLKEFFPPTIAPIAWGAMSSCALLFVIRYCMRRDNRTWFDAGLHVERASPLRVGAGLILGIATYALTLVLLSLAAGPIHVRSGAADAIGALPIAIAGLIALAAMEELAFRSYPFWIAIRALGPWRGQAIVAIAFALIHVAYGWAWQNILFGVLPSGILFGAAAYVSRGVALPLGVHIGMNLGGLLTGGTAQHAIWTLDLSAANPASMARWTPWLGAAVPLAVSVVLWIWNARRRPAIPPASRQLT